MTFLASNDVKERLETVDLANGVSKDRSATDIEDAYTLPVHWYAWTRMRQRLVDFNYPEISFARICATRTGELEVEIDQTFTPRLVSHKSIAL